MSRFQERIAEMNRNIQAQNQQRIQQNYLNQVITANRQANFANRQREGEIRNIYDEVIRRYQPGGAFEAKSLAQLESQKKRSVTEQFGASEQQAISGGMFGVQRPTRGGMGMKWEEQVGAPARLGLEDVLMQRLTSAQTGMAGFLERIEDTGPSLSDIFNMAQAGAETSTPTSMPTPEYRKPGSGNIQTPSSTSPSVGGTGGSVQGTGGSTGGSGDGVLSQAHQAYVQDVKRANPGANTSSITLDYYKDLLAKTPKNPSRGVWKAYKEAGGTV